MCYAKPGPRCSAHARTALVKAIVDHSESPSYLTFQRVREAEVDYDMTPEGQRALLKKIMGNHDPHGKLQMRLTYGRRMRELSLAAIRAEDEGDLDNHVPVALPINLSVAIMRSALDIALSPQSSAEDRAKATNAILAFREHAYDRLKNGDTTAQALFDEASKAIKKADKHEDQLHPLAAIPADTASKVFVGSKYLKEATNRDIAKGLRKDIKDALLSGELPDEYGYKVKNDKHSFSIEVHGDIDKLVDHEIVDHVYYHLDGRPRGDGPLTDEGRRMRVLTLRMIQCYNRDASDSQSDYFDSRLYAGVTFVDNVDSTIRRSA